MWFLSRSLYLLLLVVWSSPPRNKRLPLIRVLLSQTSAYNFMSRFMDQFGKYIFARFFSSRLIK
ncbi:hypothetical protein BT93_A0747 [Corymbia citriodora subsp. variegata]|nr:hypothetical protein BT93_A0747 [Corymbia citriodora subsp. variegata]